MLTTFIQDNFKNSTAKQQNSNKPRIEFIDLAKGLCILLVVIYHTEIIRFDIPGLKALRMPLYFILSGLFFKTYGGLKEFTLKKVNNILVPFLFFYLLSAFELNLLSHGSWLEEPINFPYHLLFTGRIGPIWFLECLFITGMIFYVISSLVKNELIRAAIVIAVGISGCILGINSIFLPCQIDASLTALPFYYLGYILKKTPLLYPSSYDKYALPVGLLLFGLGCVLYYVWGKPHIEFWNNVIDGSIYQNYILSAIVVLGVLMICKTVKWLPVISYMGRYSIIILVTHELVLNALKTFAPFLRGYGINYIYFIVTFGICWLSIPLLRKYMPWVVAQKPLFPLKWRRREHTAGVDVA